jgi:hypothetical protein
MSVEGPFLKLYTCDHIKTLEIILKIFQIFDVIVSFPQYIIFVLMLCNNRDSTSAEMNFYTTYSDMVLDKL